MGKTFITSHNSPTSYSIVIRNGTIVDGTGNDRFKADVAIIGDKIVKIASTIEEVGETDIEAQGLIVAPGFIDIHTHTDRTIFDAPLANSKIFQGVTTEVTGNCGSGLFPRKRIMKDETSVSNGETWYNYKDFAASLDSLGLGINIICLVPHGVLRQEVIGWGKQPPTAADMTLMKSLLENALRQGAWGMSTGLTYIPGSYATTDELLELAKVLHKHEALYASHIRSEGSYLIESIKEAIKIGKNSGARIQVSHLKAMGRKNWGKVNKALELLQQARLAGVHIYADQYPYTASSTKLMQLLPSKLREGGTAQILQRLSNDDMRKYIIQRIDNQLNRRGGAVSVMVINIQSEKNRSLDGKFLSEVGEILKIPPAEAVIRLLIDEKCEAGAIFFAISEDDMLTILADTTVAIGSDGSAYRADAIEKSTIHPRSYGTFARVLGMYVREKKVLSLENAIHKMTALPAKQLRLNDRGVLKQNYVADIVIFDPERIRDRAEYTNPHQYAEGVLHVLVNGAVAIREGKLTGIKAGKVLNKRTIE